MAFTRDSAWWWLLLIAGAATFLGGHYDLITAAFPGVSSAWQARIELLGGVATFIAGYLRMSPLALSHTSELRGQAADPNQTLSVTGSKLPEKAAMVLLAIVVSSSMACAPKQYRIAISANQAYAQAVFAVQDAEIASHDAKLIPDDKHQDYKRIIAKLLRAGDAVTIALQHWEPGTPMPQVVAGAFKDAADLFADVSVLFPSSDPFVDKIREVLTILQKFGLIPSEPSGVAVDWDALAAPAFDRVNVFGIGSVSLRINTPSHDREVAVKRVVVQAVLSRSFDRGCDVNKTALMPTVRVLDQKDIHALILHPEVTLG